MALLISAFWFLGCGSMRSLANAGTEAAGVSMYRVDGLRGSLIPKSPSPCNAALHLRIKSQRHTLSVLREAL